MAQRSSKTWRSYLARWHYGAIGIFLLTFFALGFYLAQVYGEISTLIDERHAALTSTIYSAPLAFEAGDEINRLHLLDRLHHLGYARVDSLQHPGEFGQLGDNLFIYVRDFDLGVRHFPANVIRLTTDKQGKIVGLADQAGTQLKRAVLDPQVIGRLMPNAPAERVEVRVDQVKPEIIKTLLTTEDRFFFYHPGFDPIRIIEAAVADYRSGRWEQGASTLTQQLARTFIQARERTLRRKARELAVALVLEMRLNKQQILERYLNDVYMGEYHGAPIYGLPMAARYFFNKDLRDLDYVETATLIAIIRAPSLYDPRRHPDDCKERRDMILGLMRRSGIIIDDSALAAARAAPIRLAPEMSFRTAPFFTDYITAQVSKMPGIEGHLAGLKVYTTLDPEFQTAGETAVVKNIEKLEREHRNLRPHDDRVLEGSLVALDPDSGAIRAMVGGRNYQESQFNRAAMGERQTGSAFKPVVYVTALDPDRSPLERPLTLASLLPDKPMSFNGWEPVDYEGTYRGEVTVAEALAESLNIPTAYVGSLLTPPAFIRTAHELGIQEKYPNVLPIAIGAGETTLLELTGAYQVFAAAGMARPPYGVESIVDGHSHLVYQHQFVEKRLIKADVAYLITGALQGVIRHGTGARAGKLGLNFPAAGKTGTTQDYHDAYFMGYSPDLVCGVWVGFDDPESIGLTGAQAALPAWVDFMVNAAPSQPANFEVPPGITMVSIDLDSGCLGEGYSRTDTLPFLSGSEPRHTCEPRGGGEPGEPPTEAEMNDEGEVAASPPYRTPPPGRNMFDEFGNFIGKFFR